MRSSECGSLCRLSQQLVHLRIRCELHCCLAVLPLQVRKGIGVIAGNGCKCWVCFRACRQAGNIGLNLRKSNALMKENSIT